MKDKEKSKERLIQELTELRRQITELKASETKPKGREQPLKESEKRYRTLFDTSPDGILITTLDGKILEANQAYRDMVGYTLKELKDMTYQQLTPEKWHQEEQAAVESFLSGKGSGYFEKEYINKDGAIFPISLRGWIIKDHRGNPEGIGVFVRDISERKRAEETLKESEEKFRDLFENANDLIQSVDGDGRFVCVNKKWLETLGYSEEELGELKLTDILREDQIPHCMEIFKKVRGGRSFEKVETIFMTKHGSEIVVEGNINAKIKDGRFVATRGIFRDITEQKKVEEAYRALVENSLQGLGIAQDNKVAFVNPTIAEMLGYTIEELMSFSHKEWKDVIHPDDQAFVMGRLQDRMEGKPVPPRYEVRMMRKDGRAIWVELFSSCIKYGGKPAIQAAFVDITERKRVEEKLRSVEQQKATILNSMAEHVVYYDKEMRILWANKAAGKSAGLPPEEMAGRHCYEVWRQQSRPCINCPVIEAVRTGEPHQAEMTSTDGRVWFINGHPVRDANGTVIGVVEITLEITERKLAEDALRESEEKFRNLAEQSPSMIFINKKGRVVYANKKCEEITGYTREEFYSPEFDFFTLISLESRGSVKANFTKHLKGEEIAPLEYTLITKVGGKIKAILTTKLIKYEGENAILGTVTDITERKRMEEELLKARKLESIGILAGGIAHDFNNILTGILGNISLAKAKASSEDEIFRILIKAEKASLRARSLTQQLLTFSKGGAPVKATTSIGELIRDSADFVLRGSNVRCEFSIPDDLWPVEIDKGQINQVLDNLIINADQAMPEGGSIAVSAVNFTLEEKESSPLRPGKYVRITVEDQGIGIPRQHLQKIFDPYFSTKKKGNGLGLATSYSIVKNHDGHIQARSKLGVGASFVVYLPASPKKVPKTKHPEPKPLSGKGRILVMDDEEVVRDVVGDLLAILGYVVEFAKDGAEVIELYKKAQGSAQPFDAVIMDLTVPGGMGGKESIQKLLEIDPEARAIVSSGYCNDQVMSEFKKYGFSGVVAKPFKIEDLGEVLHRVLVGTSKTPA